MEQTHKMGNGFLTASSSTPYPSTLKRLLSHGDPQQHCSPSVVMIGEVQGPAPPLLQANSLLSNLPHYKLTCRIKDLFGCLLLPEPIMVIVPGWEEVGRSLSTQCGGSVERVEQSSRKIDIAMRWEEIDPDGSQEIVAFLERLGFPAAGDFEAVASAQLIADSAHVLRGHRDKVTSVTSLGDDRVASASRDGTIIIWDSEGRVQKILGNNSMEHGSHDEDMVLALCVLEDGRLASGSADSNIRLWCIFGDEERFGVAGADGQLCGVLRGHDGRVLSLACLRGSGWWLVSSSSDASVRIWDSEGSCVHVLRGHTKPVWCCAGLVGPGMVASGSADCLVKIWSLDLEYGGAASLGGMRPLEMTLAGHTDSVFSVVALGHSGRLASASGDRTIRLWEQGDGACLRVLTAHTGSVRSLFFSSSRCRLVSGSWDRQVIVWRNVLGKEAACVAEQVLLGHTSWVSCVAPTPRGIVSASDDGTCRTWMWPS